MKIFALLMSCAFLLGGCASNGNSYSNYSQFHQFKLNKPITVAADSSYVYVISPGKVVRRKEIGNYELYCRLAVPRPKGSGETIIQPDVFDINRISRRFSFNKITNPIVVAYGAYGHIGGGGVFGMNHGSRQDVALYLDIHSTRQPQVKSVSCIRFTDPYFGNTPTISQAQEVFQGLAEFVPIN